VIESEPLCLQEHLPGLQHRQKRMAERWVVFDRAADCFLEWTTPQAYRQPDAEDLEQSTNFIFEVKALSLHYLSAGEKCSGVVAFDALYMHPAVPPRSK